MGEIRLLHSSDIANAPLLPFRALEDPQRYYNVGELPKQVKGVTSDQRRSTLSYTNTTMPDPQPLVWEQLLGCIFDISTGK